MNNLKPIAKILLILGACIAVTGCGHEHTWTQATCIQAKVCSECGETEGEPVNHDFTEATCTKAKTCNVCGVTDGEAKGHDFTEATCAGAKTCKVCGITEGDALEHEWIDATFDAPKTCTQCGATEGGTLVIEEVPELYDIGNSDVSLVPGGYISDNFTNSGFAIKYCDYDGNVKCEIPFEISSASSKTYTYRLMAEGIIAIYTNFVGSKDFGDICNTITVTDFEGNVIDTKDLVVNSFNLAFDNVNIVDGYYVFCKSDGSIATAYDLNAQKFVDADVVEEICSKFDEYSYYLYCPEANCYLVGLGDNYGFADNDGNIIKMFDDASPFSKEGYALVIEDGKVSLVDKNIEVVKENFAIGTSANSIPGREFLSIGNNGKRVYYRIATSDAADTVVEEVSKEESEDVSPADAEDKKQDDSEKHLSNGDNIYVDELEIGDKLELGQTLILPSGQGSSIAVYYLVHTSESEVSSVGSDYSKGNSTLVLGTMFRQGQGQDAVEVPIEEATKIKEWYVSFVTPPNDSNGNYVLNVIDEY